MALKLDIDHPDTEMPIALSLLGGSGSSSGGSSSGGGGVGGGSDAEGATLAELVDEFFFELHFRCEVMTSCGWGKQVIYTLPAYVHASVYICICICVRIFIVLFSLSLYVTIFLSLAPPSPRHQVPSKSHGLTLDRPTVLQFFIDLRKRGVRAHIWP